MTAGYPLTVVIVTLNNAATIHRTLESVRWAGEIIVADKGSWDRTREIAKAINENIILTLDPVPVVPDWTTFINASTNDWILCMGGDTVVPPDLKNEILEIFSQQTTTEAFTIRTYYSMKRQNMILPDTLNSSSNFLVHKKSTYVVARDENPLFEESQGDTARHHLVSALSSVEQWIDKINERTSLSVTNRKEQAVNILFYWWRMAFFPFARFCKCFLGQRLYRNGLEGFVYSVLCGIHQLGLETKSWEYKVQIRNGSVNIPPITVETLRSYHHR